MHKRESRYINYLSILLILLLKFLNGEKMIKRLAFTLLACSFIFCELFSQKVIMMEEEGGVYRIPCTVNGAKMKMIFDTGASNVSLSMSIAEYLLDNDFIKKEDFIGKGKALIADGSSVDTYHLILRDVEIDGLHLENVEASISASQNAPLLLGLSAIQKLGKISIEGNKLIIYAAKKNYSSTEIAKLRNEINEAMKNNKMLTALEKLEELKQVDSLTVKDLSHLTFAYFGAKKFKECTSAGLDYLKNSKNQNENDIGIISEFVAMGYEQIGNFSEAEYYYKKALEYTYRDKSEYEDIYCSLGNLFIGMGQLDNARYYINKGLDLSIIRIGCTIKDIEKGLIQDKKLADLLHREWAVNGASGLHDKANYWLKLSAQCGSIEAQKQCDQMGVKYKLKSHKK